MDMFSYETEDFLWERTYMDSHETIRPGLDPDTAMKIAENLVNAKNPVIYAGGGVLLARLPKSWLHWLSSWRSPWPAP